MTRVNSTLSTPSSNATKPKKPHPDFPLFPHPNGQWCKKVHGKQHFFGVWADPDAALNRWLQDKDDILAGRVRRVSSGCRNGPTLRELVNQFLTTKQRLTDSGDPAQQTCWLRQITTSVEAITRCRSCDTMSTPQP